MQVKKFDDLHRSKGVTHIYVAQCLRFMVNPGDKAGEMRWSRIRSGEIEFPKPHRGRKIKRLAEIYGVSVDLMLDLFDLDARTKGDGKDGNRKV